MMVICLIIVYHDKLSHLCLWWQYGLLRLMVGKCLIMSHAGIFTMIAHDGNMSHYDIMFLVMDHNGNISYYGFVRVN